MTSTVHFSQITEPELLDVVDDAWLQDKLPDDSKFPARCCCRAGDCCPNCPMPHTLPAYPVLYYHAAIPVPAGMHGFTEEFDEQQEQRTTVTRKERWLDLGLQQLH